MQTPGTTQVTQEEKEKVSLNKKETPISRQERRRREKINQEVQEAHRQLSDKFLNFFIECENPEGQEVVDKMKQIDAQWRLFCRRKGLIAKAYPLMNDYMEGLLKEYIQTKENGKGKEETTSEAGE